MRVSVFVFIFMFLVVAVLWQGGEATFGSSTPLLLDVMEAAGCDVAEGEASYWGSMNRDYLSAEELDTLAGQVISAIGLREEGQRKYVREANFNMVDVTGTMGSGVTGRVILQSAETNSLDDGGTYLLVQLQEDSGGKKVLEAGERLETALIPLGAKGDLTLHVLGYLPGEMSAAGMSALARELCTDFQVEVVEGVEDENLVSLTGYTPLVNHYMYSGGEKINFNIALRYNNHEDATTLRVGLPLINGGY